MSNPRKRKLGPRLGEPWVQVPLYTGRGWAWLPEKPELRDPAHVLALISTLLRRRSVDAYVISPPLDPDGHYRLGLLHADNEPTTAPEELGHYTSPSEAAKAAKADWTLRQFDYSQEDRMRNPRRKTRRKKGGARKNPHTSEWMIVGVNPADKWKMMKVVQGLLKDGYGTDYEVRDTTEGAEKAWAVKIHDVPEISRAHTRKRDPNTAYAPGPPWVYRNNATTIASYLGQFGRIVGMTTYSRTNPTFAAQTVRRILAKEGPTRTSMIVLIAYDDGVSKLQVLTELKRMRDAGVVEAVRKSTRPNEWVWALAKKRQAKLNPSRIGLAPLAQWEGEDVYDPREEAIRAQERHIGFPMARGDRSVYRQWSPEKVIDVSRQRYEGTYVPRDGKRRTIDDLIRGRQKYELMLGERRRAGPFRILLEPTKKGLRFFIWPLPEGQRKPKPYATRAGADKALKSLYSRGVQPSKRLPERKYTKAELADWLPPAWVFQGKLGTPSRAAAAAERRPRPRRRERVERAGEDRGVTPDAGLRRRYEAYDPEWFAHASLRRSYKRGEEPPGR